MDEALRRSLRAIDPEDAESRARAVMARVRAGAIDEDRLVIAAQAGDPTAVVPVRDWWWVLGGVVPVRG